MQCSGFTNPSDKLRFARSPQWYHERPNRSFSALQKACFKYIPFWQRYHRLSLFRENDSLVTTYVPGEQATVKRKETEDHAKQYIYAMTPKKYHDFIVPKFPLGCKRRIFDPNYLEALHAPNLDLVPEGIQRIDGSGIVNIDGSRDDFDVIILATGFQVTNFLTPMEIIGTEGKSLADQWAENVGAQAYFGTYVHNFPNMAILFGPNTFPAHNSALFSCEVQVEFVTKSLFRPILDGKAELVEVKATAEDSWIESIDKELDGSVFSAGCSNWYINSAGRNSASWPGYASTFWRKTFFPRFADFEYEGGNTMAYARAVLRSNKWILAALILVAGYKTRTRLAQTVQTYLGKLLN
jgi:cation diffusion facilitator CzcD-associated flavoprotein CzcO